MNPLLPFYALMFTLLSMNPLLPLYVCVSVWYRTPFVTSSLLFYTSLFEAFVWRLGRTSGAVERESTPRDTAPVLVAKTSQILRLYAKSTELVATFRDGIGS